MKKNLTPLIALSVLIPAPQIYADEVRLICSGVHSGTRRVESGTHYDENTGRQKTEYANVPYETELVREIRFDEDANEFWYKGSEGLSTRNSEDGWIPAKELEFSEAEIVVEFTHGAFKIFRDVLSLGITRLTEGKPIGTLDRYSGIWRILGYQMNCLKLDVSERRF